MTREEEYSNESQSEWLVRFFKKYPGLKPEAMAYIIEEGSFWIKPKKQLYDDRILLYSMEGSTHRYFDNNDRLNSHAIYTLRQLEGILPDHINNGGIFELEPYYIYDADNKRVICWGYSCAIGVPGKLWKKISPRVIKIDPIHNIIELLKWLDENGHLGDLDE